jgi:hypothetical protein
MTLVPMSRVEIWLTSRCYVMSFIPFCYHVHGIVIAVLYIADHGKYWFVEIPLGNTVIVPL